jgi:hypothetical protein
VEKCEAFLLVKMPRVFYIDPGCPTVAAHTNARLRRRALFIPNRKTDN